jgi:hypothetical protein
MSTHVDQLFDAFIGAAIDPESSRQKREVVRTAVTARKADIAKDVTGTVVFASDAITSIAAKLEDAKARYASGSGSQDEIDAQSALLKTVTSLMAGLQI